ncbi:hypothetical protein STVIR_6201 [Streptomyces viridochromogenes Tue57]|uniref:Uncharacterized protein n=1 Tax=Streptomyces viridochromogenes Tue57 TaxID=1160705 RepID=L8P9I3_STRVR|nr:hypothetical protein STVIR_6201 [Streptomyces viridochromogenes Tue57]
MNGGPSRAVPGAAYVCGSIAMTTKDVPRLAGKLDPQNIAEVVLRPAKAFPAMTPPQRDGSLPQ